MKISRFAFPNKEKNNRETYATRRCSGLDVRQHSRYTDPRTCGRRAQLQRSVQTVGLKRRYENRTRPASTLPSAASRGIVPSYAYAAAALTAMALPLDWAAYSAGNPRRAPVAARLP